MVKTLKYIDKFLNWLKTDRNTFVTYILTLASIYIMIDRIVEIIMLLTSGVGVSYWGPIQYTFALACPVFAFLFSGSSQFASSYKLKVTYLYVYCIALYIVGISMVIQWINAFLWGLFLSVPNYTNIVVEFSQLIRPAFQAIAFYPLLTAYPLFKWLYTVLNETKDIRDGINDYGGIDLSDKNKGWGPYTCETVLCFNKVKGTPAKIPESRRFDPALIVGISGTGKTMMVFEPLMARDIEKKYFFKEVSKEMGYTALKTGIAHLIRPYNNDYLNDNFSLTMLAPNDGKEAVYKAYMEKMICSESGPEGKIVYKDLGITSISPDIESTNRIAEVAKNYNIPVNLIDPNNPDSIGLNPFIFEEPSLTALAVSTVLRGMYVTSHTDVEQAYRENTAAQAIENLSILLKVMYPRLHNGDMPTLEDMLKMLNNFDLVEDMCKKMEEIPELAEKYDLQLGYFKKHFYQDSVSRPDTEKFVYSAITQLDGLLRLSNVRNILCNRTHNIDFDKALANGEITLLCTRRGDLGSYHTAFGLFFILLMQFSILRRPGSEKSRIPHFFYVDEFPDYLCRATEPLYTIYRKYKVGTVISSQTLSQLGLHGQSKSRDTIMSNATTKLVFGGITREESELWEKEFGDHREWKMKFNYDTKEIKYESKGQAPEWAWKENIKSGKLQAFKFKECAYIVKDVKGRNNYGDGKVDFLEAKYKEAHSPKKYDFGKVLTGVSEDKQYGKKNIDLTKADFKTDYHGDIDPIRSDEPNLFDNQDAIVFNFKKPE